MMMMGQGRNCKLSGEAMTMRLPIVSSNQNESRREITFTDPSTLSLEEAQQGRGSSLEEEAHQGRGSSMLFRRTPPENATETTPVGTFVPPSDTEASEGQMSSSPVEAFDTPKYSSGILHTRRHHHAHPPSSTAPSTTFLKSSSLWSTCSSFQLFAQLFLWHTSFASSTRK